MGGSDLLPHSCNKLETIKGQSSSRPRKHKTHQMAKGMRAAWHAFDSDWGQQLDSMLSASSSRSYVQNCNPFRQAAKQNCS